MKHLNYLLGVALLLLGISWASAETVTNYTVDFNTTIDTSNKNFKVAPGWAHIASTSYYGMSYAYVDNAGVDGTGALKCNDQSSSSLDYLVTPAITGDISLMVKLTSTSGASRGITFYAITEDETGALTVGDALLTKVGNESGLSADEYTAVTLTGLNGQRIGIVGYRVYLDDFVVDGTADIVLEPGLTITNVVSSVPSSGTILCDENNNYSFTYTITVKNTGEIDLPADYENLSVSIVRYNATDALLATTPIGQALAIGDEATVDVTLNMNYADYPGRTRYDAKENVSGTTKTVTPWVEVKPYLPEITLRNESGWDMIDNPSYGAAFGSFGMVSADLTKVMKVRNSGAAPGVINITVPEGFTADPASFTVAASSEQSVNVTLSAANPGIKSGDLAVNVEGVNEPLTIALSGTVLDSSKFFENFEANNTSDMMPAGWWDIDNEWEKTDNTNGNNNYVSADLVAAHKLITPLLKVTEGEKMSFEARKKSSSSELFVNVYYSHDRKEWTLVKEISASDMDQTNFQTYVVEGVPAGDFYIAFESGYCAIDNVYGFELVPVDVDVVVKEFRVPSTIMANNDATATVKLQNLLGEAVSADYAPAFYFNNVKVAEAEPVEIPAQGSATIQFAFVANEVGTFPAKAEFVFSDDYTVVTDDLEVTVNEESANDIVQVGEATTSSAYAPVRTMYNNSESKTIYTAEQLGINNGAMITSLTYKGYMSGSKVLTPTVSVWVENTEDATETTSATLFDTEDMMKVFEGECTIEPKGSSSEMVDMLVINFDTPFEYTGKNLRVIVRSLYTDWQTSYFEADGNVSGQCVVRFQDNQNTFLTGNASTYAANLPVVYLGIEKEAVVYTGIVKDTDGNLLEGVTVTLTSQVNRDATAGPAVYTATTDGEGKFTVNVVQADKTYDATFSKDGYKDVNVEGISFANGSVALSEPVVMELDNVTGVNGINAGKTVQSVKYYNVAGQAADKAFQGVNIVVTTYTDGTTQTVKVIK